MNSDLRTEASQSNNTTFLSAQEAVDHQQLSGEAPGLFCSRRTNACSWAWIVWPRRQGTPLVNLSEPTSLIFVYTYMIHTWSYMCIMCKFEDKCTFKWKFKEEPRITTTTSVTTRMKQGKFGGHDLAPRPGKVMDGTLKGSRTFSTKFVFLNISAVQEISFVSAYRMAEICTLRRNLSWICRWVWIFLGLYTRNAEAFRSVSNKFMRSNGVKTLRGWGQRMPEGKPRRSGQAHWLGRPFGLKNAQKGAKPKIARSGAAKQCWILGVRGADHVGGPWSDLPR